MLSCVLTFFTLSLLRVHCARVLIAYDSSAGNVQETHSQFISSLDNLGFNVTVMPVGDAELFSFGERKYDNVVFFGESIKKWGSKFSMQSLVDFVNSKGNLIIQVGESNSKTRNLVNTFGFELDVSSNVVQDPLALNRHADNEDKTLFIVRPTKFITNPEYSVLYKGVGFSLNPVNKLTFSILTGTPTTYSYEKGKNMQKETTLLIGKNVNLVGALQARNNARVVVSGSLKLFSNEFFNAPLKERLETPKEEFKSLEKSENQKFVSDVLKWTFGQKKILRVKNVNHFKVPSTDNSLINPSRYTIKDGFHYEISLEEFRKGEWKPFKLPHEDRIQLQVVMLDPYIVVDLVSVVPGTFSTPSNMSLPDVVGIYTFKVSYWRKGFSYITEKNIVSIVPFRHDEFPRYISTGYPYYTNMWSLMIAFWIFTATFMYFKDPKEKQKVQ